MEMPLVLKVDNFGRITLPKNIRNAVNALEFEVLIENREIRLKPVPSWEEMKGAFPKLDMVSFKKEHDEEWE